ncbi:SMP-30/gluconolactonase/LRE family protein [Pelomonas aquatica]|jgi:sugar lactone lactonase YvrE|uniref:SMP-30/gluconolactonase/LRE family protein n=1 Tax=Pelomonas aquatica TaxID=431058 RepID=A0A9X4R5U5_9BURK|nr:SMP-30/gluconolactonase/LRE family protein [Pelomonas aquatica]MCY4756110.1 SMP-30/gluconolactonase/LRE family protein [Pelomonas aquatica]MDG0864071.1 SMP-30/gluconolactonase/LRE family protein [Pelomonas aquatica]
MALEPDIQPLGAHRCLLGESPLWHPTEQCLYAVDIPGRQVLRWREGADMPDMWPQDAEPGCIAARAGGGLLVARRDGLWALDTSTGAQHLVSAPPYDPARLRFNDGKVDPAGRLWVGSISDAREPEAALYRFDGGAFAAQVPGLTTSNGLAWSPDGRRMHWSDTKAHRIYVADFDVATGTLSSPRVCAEFKPRTPGEAYGGRPDGAAMDAEGHYWAAMFEGGCVLRIAPGGDVVRRIDLPVTCPTMPTFGGADGRTLFVTTAREKRPAEELAREPLAGAVLQLRVDVPGLPATLTQA